MRRLTQRRITAPPIPALIPTLIPTLTLALFLAGCSGGTDFPTLYLQIFDAGRAALAAQKQPQTQGQNQGPALTRAQLDTLDGAFLEVVVERRKQQAYLFVDLERRDDSPGKITVWRTQDNVTITVRNGVLIATRGLSGDVLSSTVQVSGDRPGPSASGEKVHSILALDNKAVRLALACDLVDLGPDPIVIIEQRHDTRHLQERCTTTGARGAGGVVNDYWVDSRNGLVWKSRQWAGPEIGYLRLRQVTN